MSFLKGLLKKANNEERESSKVLEKTEPSEAAVPQTPVRQPFFCLSDGEYHLYPDLCIGIGRACQTAHFMREYNLSRHSYPLDWMMLYSLDTVYDLYKTKFEFFFKDIIDTGEVSGENRKIICAKYGINDVHFFPVSQSLEEGKKHHNDMMKRRAERLFEDIAMYERILLLCGRGESQDELINFTEKFCELFPGKDVIMLNLRNGPDKNTTIRFGSTRKLLFLEEQFVDEHPDGTGSDNPNYWLGNEPKWDAVMQRITRSE